MSGSGSDGSAKKGRFPIQQHFIKALLSENIFTSNKSNGEILFLIKE